MTEAEFFERFDRHLARMDAHVDVANQHMARGETLMVEVREAVDRNREKMAQLDETIDRSRRAYEDSTVFIREITRRNEVVWQGVVGELADMRDETRANTQAVLRVLDRLDPQD